MDLAAKKKKKINQTTMYAYMKHTFYLETS